MQTDERREFKVNDEVCVSAYECGANENVGYVMRIGCACTTAEQQHQHQHQQQQQQKQLQHACIKMLMVQHLLRYGVRMVRFRYYLCLQLDRHTSIKWKNANVPRNSFGFFHPSFHQLPATPAILSISNFTHFVHPRNRHRYHQAQKPREAESE